MAVSRKPLARDLPADHDGDEDFNLPAPTAMEFEPDPEEKQLQADDDKFKALEEQIKMLQSKLDERQNVSFDPLMYSPPQAPEIFKPENLVEVPNIDADPDGYVKATAANAAIATRNEAAKREFARKQEQDLNEKVQGLWDDFADLHPDLAGDQSRVEFAAAEVIKKVKRRGIDAQRYMFASSDRFLNDVAKKYEEIFGAPSMDEDDDENDEPRSRSRSRKAGASSRRSPRARSRDEDDDTSRTAGIFGSYDSGSRRKPAEDDAGSMIDDLHALQRKTGFF